MRKTTQHTVPWWKQGVIYQIYPRSFLDSNQDGIGDINGIIAKLDYLNDGTEHSLGVDALWISPLYQSPMKDFGYDISDYQAIDGMFGSLEDFKLLLEEAHKRQIRVIMDLVINHTSDQHPWFREARQSKDNPKRDWFIWQPNKGKKPNNWVASFELKNAWWLDRETNEYYLGTFTRHQPELNWRNPELKEAVYKMIRFWLDVGVDGFRMDVANFYIKDEHFRNNPWQLSLNPLDVQKHIYDRNRPETHDICKEIRALTDEYADRMLVGEIYTNDVREAISYQGNGENELHLAFNFSFLFEKWSARGFYQNIKEYYDLLPKGAWPNFTLSNHDQPRHYYRYRDGQFTDARAKVAAALLLTLQGTPFIYYGEEIGMTCERIDRRDIQDPLGKKGWPIIRGRDAERTPMQWDASANAGFSKVKPWLRVNSDYRYKNVMAQSQDKESLLNFYKSLTWLRKKNSALSLGELHFTQEPKQVLIYKRKYESEEVTVILNFSRQQESINIEEDSKMWVLLGTHKPMGEELPLGSLSIQPYEVIISSSKS